MTERTNPAPALIGIPVYYVRIPIFTAVTGYSADAVDKKIRTGVWLEGRHFRRAPDGHILLDLRKFHEWVESPKATA